jgi:hypothetical protein
MPKRHAAGHSSVALLAKLQSILAKGGAEEKFLAYCYLSD